MSNIVLSSNFDINKISYDKIKVFKSDGGGAPKTQIFVKYAGGPFMMQTPWAVVPFGVSNPMESKEWAMDLDLDHVNTKSIEGGASLNQEVLEKKLKDYKNMLKQLDTRNTEQIVSQWAELYPTKKVKNATELIEDEVYISLIKKPSKVEYSDKFRVKLGQPYIDEKTGKKSFTVYGGDDKEIEWYNDQCRTALEAPWNQKKMLVQCILICTGLWVVGTKIYCSFKVMSVRVKKPLEVGGFSFITEDDEVVKSAEDVNGPVVLEDKTEEEKTEEKLVVAEEEEEEFEDYEDE